MLKRWIAVSALLAELALPSAASAGSLALLGAGSKAGGGGGGGCATATAVLGYITGLSGPESAAATTFICASKADGTWDKLDALWIFAVNSHTTADKNWIASGVHDITESSTPPSFANDLGFTGNGTSAYLDTNFAMNGGTHFLQNSSTIGVYLNNTSRAADSSVAIGFNDGTSALASMFIRPRDSFCSGPQVFDYDKTLTCASDGTSNGAWQLTRTGSGSGAGSLYHAGSAASGFGTVGASSAAQTTFNNIYILAQNDFGVGTDQYSSDRVGAAWIGAFNTTDMANFYNDLQAYMVAVGGNV